MIHKSIISGDYKEQDKIRGYIAYIISIEDGYKTKIKEYIQGFRDNSITCFNDAVNAFNENKLYKEVKDFKLIDSCSFIEDEYVDGYMASIFYERQDFLVRHGYIDKPTDKKEVDKYIASINNVDIFDIPL